MTWDLKETMSSHPGEFGVPQACLQPVGSQPSCSCLDWPGLQRGSERIGRPTRGRPCFASPAPPHRGPPGLSSTAALSDASWALLYLTQHRSHWFCVSAHTQNKTHPNTTIFRKYKITTNSYFSLLMTADDSSATCVSNHLWMIWWIFFFFFKGNVLLQHQISQNHI